MKNRVLSFVLVFVIALSLVSTAPLTAKAASTPSGWAVESVEEAKTLGLTTNELLNDFSATTTRLEFCRAAVNLLRQYGYNVDSVTPKMFSDTSDRDIGIAAALGITNGTDAARNLFSPYAPLTREQAATLLNNVLGVIGRRVTGASVAWSDAASISNWATQSASDMYHCGVIGGTDSKKLVFSPKTPYTHEQSIVTLLRMWTYISPSNNTYDSADFYANLRQSQNEIILNDDVQSIVATSANNILISADEASRKYVFESVDDTIRNLVVGDKFIIQPCTSIPDGLAIIVKSISVSGSTATILSDEVDFSDIVESMDIAQIIPMTSDMITDYGPGVSPAIITSNVQQMSFSNNDSQVSTLSLTGSLYTNNAYMSTPTLAPVSASVGDTITLPINIPINDSIRVTGSIVLSPTLKADIDLHEGWFNIPSGLDYFELSLDNKMQSTLKLEATYNGTIVDMASVSRVQDGKLVEKYANYKMTKAKCDAYRQKLFTSAFPIPTAPGLAATVTWYINVTASGQISLEAVYTQNNSFGIKYENTKWSPINTNESKLTVSGAADASLYAGVGIGIGLSYVKVVSATLEPEVGIEIAASTEYNAALIDSSGSEQTSDHDCYLCVDGDVNLKLSLAANIEAWGVGSVYKSSDLLNCPPRKLLDFYYSFGSETHSAEFELGECPHKNSPADSSTEIAGSWSGVYFPSQGESALNLIIEKTSEPEYTSGYKATFNFSSLPGRTNSQTGSYYMTVDYDENTNIYTLKGKKWIRKPLFYSFADLIGVINGNTFSSTTGTKFSLQKIA